MATPLTAATFVVLPVNPPGPPATAILTFEEFVDTTLPNASSMATVIAGARAWPAVPVVTIC